MQNVKFRIKMRHLLCSRRFLYVCAVNALFSRKDVRILLSTTVGLC